MSLTKFNLLQDIDSPPDIWDNIYGWVTKVGRSVIMVVEIIVIAAFVGRIIIDTQTKDLLDKQTQDTQQLQSFQSKEAAFRDTQQKFTAYKLIWNASSTYAKVIQDINSILPNNIQQFTMSVRDNIITVKGTGDVNQISSFEKALKSNTAEFTDVQVLQVQDVQNKQTSQQADFGIKLTVNSDLLIKRTPIGTVTAKPVFGSTSI